MHRPEGEVFRLERRARWDLGVLVRLGDEAVDLDRWIPMLRFDLRSQERAGKQGRVRELLRGRERRGERQSAELRLFRDDSLFALRQALPLFQASRSGFTPKTA
jgi:hypothetical protein